MISGEDLLALQLASCGVEAQREYRFGAMASGGAGKGLRARLKETGLSDWRADFAVIDRKLLIEVEGGGWTGGRHTRGAGFEGDLVKYGEAQLLGWTVYRCSPAMVRSGKAIQTITALLSYRKTR